MAKRTSIYIEDFKLANPIPSASRIGGIVASGIINGVDPATGRVAATLEDQCRHMFAHMKRIVEASGGSTDDILKVTVWMKDRGQRDALNQEWVKMFPDPATRPARHAMRADLEGGILVQCDFMAVIG